MVGPNGRLSLGSVRKEWDFLAPFISKVAQPQPLNRSKQMLYHDDKNFFHAYIMNPVSLQSRGAPEFCSSIY